MSSVIPEMVASVKRRLEACPGFLTAMNIIGRRWSGLIVQALAKGCHTFSQISCFAVGPNDASLPRRLKELENERLLVRIVADGRPPEVAYRLTAAGEALAPIPDVITTWGNRYICCSTA